MQIYRLKSPLWLQQSKKKRFSLNLNIYRNAHHRVSNSMKIKYKQLMSNQISKLPVFPDQILIMYVVYPKTKRKFDLGNVCSIHDKFFCDALVEHGKIVDDDYTFIPEIRYRMGEVDKLNPRVEILIKPVKEHPNVRNHT